MKKYLVYFVITILIYPVYAQVSIRSGENVPTGYLYDLSHQLSKMENFDGSPGSSMANKYIWNQLYFEINESHISGQDYRSVTSVNKQAGDILYQNRIPVGLLFYHYNILDGNVKDFLDDRGKLDLSQATFREKTLFAAAAFQDITYDGKNLVFTFPEALRFPGKIPGSLLVDFDDGMGWRTVSGDMAVSYAVTGEKTIRVKLITDQGETLTSNFRFEVDRLVTPEPTATWNVQADQGYNGVTTSGDAYVLLSDQNTKLTKPVVVSEGIDFDDTYTWDYLYELFNQQNMIEDLRSEGFDIVVLNFHDPLTYIQSNGFLFMKLIEMVNDTISYQAPLSIVGPSMGGLVTRYALTYMEDNGIDHNCNLWISFETPNLGANIPLGIQYAVYFFKDLDANVQMLLDILDGPAAKEMLAYHYTIPVSSPAVSDPLFDDLQTQFAAMGDYPSGLRKIAISNGRGDAVGQPYNAGDQAIEFEYSSFLVDVTGNMWTVKDNASGLVFEGLIDPLIGATSQLNANVFSPKPYDNCPGGIRNTFAQMGDLQLPFGQIVVLLENHAYIPTVSGLALDTDDLFYNLEADPQVMQLTPFDSIYWSDDNYDHTYISPQTAQVAITEILNAQPQSQDITLTAGWSDLSSYIDPANKDILSLTAQLGDDLVILQHFGEVYWPGGGINSLNEWDYKKGYIVKVMGDHTLTVTGSNPEDKTIQISQGWNLIPVLCKDCNSIETMLGDNLGKVRIIREAVGVNIFWPEVGIYSLTHLAPGNAYYLYANEPFQLGF